MPAHTRIKPTEPTTSRQSPPSFALDKALKAVKREYQKIIQNFRRSASRARKKGHDVEAAILDHVASRLSAPWKTPEDLEQTYCEVTELLSWLPIPNRRTEQMQVERKAAAIRSIRSQKFGAATENSLIELATQAPGRPAGTRGAAVRAMELHARGQTWAQIEPGLVPHRHGVRNPGRSINREVQLLKGVLRRYGVQIDGL